jgi:hypothetical protein
MTGQGRATRTTQVARAIILAALAACSGFSLASSGSAVKPGRSDFTELTHVGKVHVVLDVKRTSGKRRLTGAHITVDDRKLEWPTELVLDVPDPQLRAMTLTSVKTYTCLEDSVGVSCPDIEHFPVVLIIPFGEIVNRSEDARCERSWLYIGILGERIESISRCDCPAGGAEEPDERILFGAH